MGWVIQHYGKSMTLTDLQSVVNKILAAAPELGDRLACIDGRPITKIEERQGTGQIELTSKTWEES